MATKNESENEEKAQNERGGGERRKRTCGW
jgi:hypothetical protein